MAAALSIRARIDACAGFAGLNSSAIRDIFGAVAINSSTSLLIDSPVILEMPVMFPPGRARLFTKPLATGSIMLDMTMGIVEVTFCAARTASESLATMTSTLSRTNSVASEVNRSVLPSAYRCSRIRFLPSTYPSSRKPSSSDGNKLAALARFPNRNSAMRQILLCCWASAASGAAASARSAYTVSRLFIRSPNRHEAAQEPESRLTPIDS